MRIVIIGGPITGKTTLAKRLKGLNHYCTDSKENTRQEEEGINYLPNGLQWGEDSEYVLSWLGTENTVIEGITVVRALRKWKERKEGLPADLIIYLTKPKAERNQDQESAAKSVETVWQEIESHFKEITLIA